MKKIALLLFIATISANAQKDYLNNNIQAAKKYVGALNNKDVDKYINLVIPEYYGGKSEYKESMVKAYRKILKNDDRKVTELQVVHSAIDRNNYQILYKVKHGNSNSFFLGISNSKDNFKFSTLFNSNMRIEQIIKIIPNLDKSFYDIIEPEWNDVIRFNVGESIPEIILTDISGTKINTNQLSDQIIVLNFWHTACGPCIKEIPDLNELVNKYPKVNFIAPISNVDINYLKEKFLVKHNFKYKIVIVDGNKFNIYSFPKHIVIKNLEVIKVIDGFSSDNLYKLETIINGLL